MTLLAWTGVALLLALAVTEVSLRAYAGKNPAFLARLRSQDILAVKVVPMGEFGFRQRPNTFLRYENGAVATANSLGYRGPEVPLMKPRGTMRVVLAGGSSTHGWGVEDHQTLDECMRRELSARHPGRRFEVINLAFDGYDAFQDYERMRLEGLGYDPDVIVVNNGINDVRNARYPDLQDPDPRTLLWRDLIAALRAQASRGGPSLKTRAKHWLYTLQFAAVVRASWQAEQIVAERALPQHETHPGAFDYFERNVRRIAGLAIDRQIALVLSTSPSSIPTKFAPDARSLRDYWIGDATATQKLREAIDTRMRRVASDLQAAGGRVRYVEHAIPPAMFLDDAHLTPDGNQVLARELCDAIKELMDATSEAPGPHS